LIVAVSEYVRKVVVGTAGHLEKRLTVARNGVDIDYWRPIPKSAGGFRAGIVCRLTRWKRVHLAVQAAAMARVELVVVGDGEERGRLEGLSRSLNASVRFVGHVVDPRPHIADCDVIVSTADREPLGLSVMESMSMGRPVIACDAGGIPEIVSDADTGMLVRDPTIAAFAQALIAARDAPERTAEMGTMARAFVESECSIDATCAHYAAAYRQVSRT
jgi:glycosyltransferase involved in cell wall biosynthesis